MIVAQVRGNQQRISDLTKYASTFTWLDRLVFPRDWKETLADLDRANQRADQLLYELDAAIIASFDAPEVKPRTLRVVE